MRVLNVHERSWIATVDELGRILESYGTDHDVLWPRRAWPPVRFGRPPRLGDDTGHGPIRYRIEAYEPGRRIRFRFTAPRGFDGTHEFEVLASGLRHRIDMRVRGCAILQWLIVIRPLHDALIEDALDNAVRASGGVPPSRSWSVWVRLLRAMLRPGRDRPIRER